MSWRTVHLERENDQRFGEQIARRLPVAISTPTKGKNVDTIYRQKLTIAASMDSGKRANDLKRQDIDKVVEYVANMSGVGDEELSRLISLLAPTYAGVMPKMPKKTA